MIWRTIVLPFAVAGEWVGWTIFRLGAQMIQAGVWLMGAGMHLKVAVAERYATFCEKLLDRTPREG